MENKLTLYQDEFERGQINIPLNEVAVHLKNHTDGCERSSFFNLDAGRPTGPAVFTFAVRKAKDILLEGCEYSGIELQLETSGQRLPKLPGISELNRIIELPDTIIYINGSPYKPSTEVYGFQQVYDDCFKCIDFLKQLGIRQDDMSIYATPEEISVEVHQDALGLMSGPDLPDLYYRLICQVCGIRESNGIPVKTDIKTVILQTVSKDYRILLPGSNHPVLHRTKVGVGASHFAYGIAAFSDYCGKKRSLQECQQEALNWVKFLSKKPEAIPGLKERIEAMPLLPMPFASDGAGVQPSAVSMQAAESSFLPLKTQLDTLSELITSSISSVKPFSFGLEKSLGGGWASGKVHVVLGPNESGKASFLLQQIMTSEKEMPVLCLSYENTLREFVTKASSMLGSINMGDMLSVLTVSGGPGDFARKSFAGAVEKFHAQISKNIYFLGTDSSMGTFDPESIRQLTLMMPGNGQKLVVVDSLQMEDFGENVSATLDSLKTIAAHNNLTVILSIHTDQKAIKRPHYIEGDDLYYLRMFQRYTASIIMMETEKVNLKRFAVMVKGQPDAALMATLEQKASQAAGGKKYKTDTYTYARVIHSSNGRRDLILYIYQPDIVKFSEVASLTMNRP